MSFNLLDAAKGLITNDLISKASAFLGESETGIAKAFSGILPALITGITEKASNNGGANTVSNLALQANSADFVGNINGFFENDSGGGLLNKGARLLAGLFDEHKTNTLTNIIANFSGIKKSSSTSLLSMVTPVVLGLLGKQAAADHLNGSGLASLLKEQKGNLLKALPSGLNLGDLFSGATSNLNHSTDRVKYAALETHEKTETGLKWLLPLLLLALALLTALFFLGKGSNKGSEAANELDSVRSRTEDSADAYKNSTSGRLDTLTQEWLYDSGKQITIDLPNNTGKLLVGENSTENKLFKFLMNTNAKIDTIKGNWFELTNVHFKSGGTQLDSTSMAQLGNIVAIIKAFPTAEFKLGGYTDNSGDSLANVQLSQKRADAVATQLKKMGTSATAITGAEGYGPQIPIADNTTPEGRAQNRRVAVRVKAK
ncbi:DUF937 domain-containing protein [Ferruginibacter sp. SUN002]|uniref:DUF937 domain-containing protein n=1 Tax=Ferruginibacter sp. SUN002 TaxID=2937789 RepID=UPI003D36C78D